MRERGWSLLLVIAVLVAAGLRPAHGQDVVLGVKGGLAITDLTLEEDPVSLETDTETGFIGGAFLTVGLGEFLAVQPEIL